jgi:Ca2+/Na+ antiporter
MQNDWKSNALGILGIIIGLISFINQEYRLLAALLFCAALVLYIIKSFSDELEKNELRIQRLEEKLKIHEQLTTMKGDIEYLKKRVNRK